jgi:hypothetical protein
MRDIICYACSVCEMFNIVLQLFVLVLHRVHLYVNKRTIVDVQVFISCLLPVQFATACNNTELLYKVVNIL